MEEIGVFPIQHSRRISGKAEGALYLLEQQILSVHKKLHTVFVYDDIELESYLKARGYAVSHRPDVETVVVRVDRESLLYINTKRIREGMIQGGLLVAKINTPAITRRGLSLTDMQRVDKRLSAIGFRYLTCAGSTLFFIKL